MRFWILLTGILMKTVIIILIISYLIIVSAKKEFIKFIFASANPKFKNFKNWDELEEIYNNLYLPIINSKKNSAMPKRYLEYNAKEIVCLKLKNPDEFQKFEDLGIIDLIKNGKISLNILSKHYDGVKFIPEIYDDLEKLRNGESIIKSFESLTDVVKKTDAGDVIEVNGKMYLNNNGKIEPWQMSREKFEELFPLVDRFVSVQGDDDCYLITVLNSLYRNPTTRGSYYKMFEQNGNDIYVTIPAYKEYGGKIKFKDGKIMTVKGSAIASKNLQMLERAYSRLSLRYPQIEGEANINPLTTKNLTFLQERIRFGLEDETFNEFVQLEGCDSIDIEKNKPKGIKILEKYAANPKYILTETVDTTGQGDLHSIVIEKYDKQAGIVYYTDPYKSWQIQRQPLSQFYNEAVDITVARL